MKHFEYVGISSNRSRELAQVLTNSIRARIQKGLDIHDQPAPPLNPRYAKAKIKHGRAPIRDWNYSGRTLAAMGPVAGADGIVVGFNNPTAARTAAILNARSQQFGISPKDRRAVIAVLNQIPHGELVRVA